MYGKLIISVCLFLGIYSHQIQAQSNLIVNYLEENSLNPNEYIVQKFKTHDVIFLGENHFIKEQVEFVKNLIPDLYENGIYYLGTEFLNYNDTKLVNRLITDSIYDETLAEQISFNSGWEWGFKEYLDIYKEAWKLNQSLPESAPKFKIFGIQETIDFSYIKSEEDYQNPEIMAKVFSGSSQFKEEEGYSAHAIQKEVLNNHQKALIHCGIHHAFTSYYQPRYSSKTKGFAGSYEKERVGNLMKDKIGAKTMTIFIHGPWYDNKGYDNQTLPVDGVLDSLFSIQKNKKLLPFGVDTKSTPFGDLKGEKSVYKYGYPDFTLKDFCDAYIFLCPISEYNSVTVISDFIKPEQVEYVKSQELDYRNKNLTAKDLNNTIKSWMNQQQKKLKELK